MCLVFHSGLAHFPLFIKSNLGEIPKFMCIDHALGESFFHLLLPYLIQDAIPTHFQGRRKGASTHAQLSLADKAELLTALFPVTFLGVYEFVL